MEGTNTHIIRPIGKTKNVTIVTKKATPYSHCSNNNDNKYDDNEKSKFSKESKSIIKYMFKYIKKSQKTFTTPQSKIAELNDEESNLKDSYDDSHVN